MGVYGQDWASYQSAAPSTAGLSFVFIKVTEGLGYTNPEWTSQRADAHAAGLVVGLYHYPHMANSPQQEADRFLAMAQPQPGEMVVLDWEGYDSANSSVSRPAQLAYKEAWLRYVKAKLPHNPVGMYCNTDYWNNVDTTGYVQDFLWIATSGKPAGQPGISANWLFHQYSDSGNVDQDYCRLGSTAELHAWAMSFQPAPAPQPAQTQAPAHPQTGDDPVAIGTIPAGFAFDAAGNPTDRSKAVVLPIPTVGDGRWPWRLVDISFGVDFDGGQPVKLRVAVHNTSSGWRVEYIELHAADARAHVWLAAGDDKVSAGRVPLSATDTASDAPVGWLVEVTA